MNRQANRINFLQERGMRLFKKYFLAGLLGIGGDFDYSLSVLGTKTNGNKFSQNVGYSVG
jgi:ABC-type transporter lipoprotein component MlaA